MALCAEVILTDEDPYDEDPRQIVEQMAAGMKREPRIVMDRREAIRTALSLARPGDAVLVTGKGTDPVHHAGARQEDALERCTGSVGRTQAAGIIGA